MKTTLVLLSAAMLAMVAGASADTVVEKPPDFGPWWHPLSNHGTYVYADCFIAPEGDTEIISLGMWLLPEGAEPGPPEANTQPGGIQNAGEKAGGSWSLVRFEIWGDAGGPDWTNVISATGPLSTSDPGLNFYSLAASPGSLVPGQKYWFAATCVGMGDPTLGTYQVGGHTQNSVYNDNCTFWYSNDPLGQDFDGQGLTPEMAFQVVLTGGVIATESLTWGRIKSLHP